MEVICDSETLMRWFRKLDPIVYSVGLSTPIWYDLKLAIVEAWKSKNFPTLVVGDFLHAIEHGKITKEELEYLHGDRFDGLLSISSTDGHLFWVELYKIREEMKRKNLEQILNTAGERNPEENFQKIKDFLLKKDGVDVDGAKVSGEQKEEIKPVDIKPVGVKSGEIKPIDGKTIPVSPDSLGDISPSPSPPTYEKSVIVDPAQAPVLPMKQPSLPDFCSIMYQVFPELKKKSKVDKDYSFGTWEKEAKMLFEQLEPAKRLMVINRFQKECDDVMWKFMNYATILERKAIIDDETGLYPPTYFKIWYKYMYEYTMVDGVKIPKNPSDLEEFERRWLFWEDPRVVRDPYIHTEAGFEAERQMFKKYELYYFMLRLEYCSNLQTYGESEFNLLCVCNFGLHPLLSEIFENVLQCKMIKDPKSISGSTLDVEMITYQAPETHWTRLIQKVLDHAWKHQMVKFLNLITLISKDLKIIFDHNRIKNALINGHTSMIKYLCMEARLIVMKVVSQMLSYPDEDELSDKAILTLISVNFQFHFKNIEYPISSGDFWKKIIEHCQYRPVHYDWLISNEQTWIPIETVYKNAHQRFHKPEDWENLQKLCNAYGNWKKNQVG